MLDKMKNAFRGIATIAVALVMVGVSTSSDAAAYRTRFDPQFSATFSDFYGVNLWWQGTAKITVPDECVFPSGSCSSGITLDDYLVEFYNGQPPPDGSGTFLDSAIPGLLLAPTLVTFDAQGIANGMDLELDLGQFVFGSGTFDVVLSFATQCSLFEGETCILWNTGTTSLFLTQVECVEDCPPGTLVNQFPPRITWVPEPASLALAGLALVAMSLARRRRT